MNMDAVALELLRLLYIKKGGLGSGNWGHGGRPGKRGGSSSKGTISRPRITAATIEQSSSEELRNVSDVMSRGKADKTQATYAFVHDKSLRSELKMEIVDELAERTNLDPFSINSMILDWASTSNDSDVNALGTQIAASQQFGIPLSDWQKERIRHIGGDSIEIFEGAASWKFNGHEQDGYETGIEAKKAVLKAMYESTQEKFRKKGIKEVILYRGASLDKSEELSEGTVVDYKANVLESWSLSQDVASDFATSTFEGVVFKAKIPVERILSTSGTGFGCLPEWEAVVLGSSEDDEAYIEEIAF